jgi:thiamine biosynthesis lipoprotein
LQLDASQPRGQPNGQPNGQPGGQPDGQHIGTQVDPETAALLNFAECQYQQSEGRFDVTAGALTRLWQHSPDLPGASEIEQALAKTGWNKVAWDGVCLQLPPGMRLDLGGIVKEYAADRVALLLRQAGFCSGFIDLGGDLHILGPHPNGRPWNVGIRHPREAGVLACVDVFRGGLASSGDYERYRMIDGKRYSHIIDARSGWPVTGLASVSVFAPSCLVAGAVSTLAMLLESDGAMRFLAQSGLHWLGYDGNSHCSNSHAFNPKPEQDKANGLRDLCPVR